MNKRDKRVQTYKAALRKIQRELCGYEDCLRFPNWVNWPSEKRREIDLLNYEHQMHRLLSIMFRMQNKLESI